MLYSDYGVEAYFETLLALESVISERIKKNNISVVNAKYKTLDELNATYVNEQGELMGTKYNALFIR